VKFKTLPPSRDYENPDPIKKHQRVPPPSTDGGKNLRESTSQRLNFTILQRNNFDAIGQKKEKRNEEDISCYDRYRFALYVLAF